MPKVNLNALKSALEESLNISKMTFDRNQLDNLDDSFGIVGGLLKKHQLEFQFERFGNVMTAKCFVRRNSKKESSALYLKCKTYSADKKESPLFKDDEISELSKILTGIQPLLKFDKPHSEDGKSRSEAKSQTGSK